MAVIIGSARHDEYGRLTGGAAGDQTGQEVATQNFYDFVNNSWQFSLKKSDPYAAVVCGWFS